MHYMMQLHAMDNCPTKGSSRILVKMHFFLGNLEVVYLAEMQSAGLANQCFMSCNFVFRAGHTALLIAPCKHHIMTFSLWDLRPKLI